MSKTFSLLSDHFLTTEQMKKIKAGDCTSLPEQGSCSCTCGNGTAFTALVTSDCDIEFYISHFCSGTNMVCECSN